MSDIANHQRVNDILLGPLERPALKWLASHMPAWVTPDMCTIVGVAGSVLTMISYILSAYDRNFLWLASLGFVINWLGDSLDGNLARYRHIERPIFGFYVDHTVDVVTEVMIFLGLGLTPYVGFSVACLALIAYLMLSVLVFIRTSVVGEFKISYGKLGPTEIRVLAILLNTFMYFGGVRTMSWTLGNALHLVFTPYDILVAAIALLLLAFFIQTSIKETARLARAGQ
ncbi:MAG: CDP-alcohol phosphatidyltransferase family protein [Bacteroidota bacterium]